MKRSSRTRILSLCVLVAVWAQLSGAQQAPSESTRSGVYTREQATRGQQKYATTCASCHGEDLSGREGASALVGADFEANWNKQPLSALAAKIRTMPPAQPNTLSPTEVVDLIGFVLSANGLPSGGSPLRDDNSVLAGLIYETTANQSASARPAPSPTVQQPAQVAQPRATTDNPPRVSFPPAEWTTFGGNLASQRYSPLDQINKDNFSQLQIAWRFKTNNLGPAPDSLYQATPLVVNGVLYTTAGTRRGVIALNPGSGELIWFYSLNEGPRGQAAARAGAGRGLSFWQSPDKSDQRILLVTPGYQLVALNAKTGVPIQSFGKNGFIDLKTDFDQNIDAMTPGIGLNAPPLVAGDVIVVGAAHNAQGNPRATVRVKGYIRAFDVKAGKRLWTFHTIPTVGEFGYDTWENDSAERNGNTGVWSQMSADAELGLVYLPTEMPGNDYYGVNRPGNNLFEESLVAVDLRTGKRKWHYQTVHHGLWDWDLPCAPILFDMRANGRTIKALAQPTKSAFLFVLNRETGDPIWPIEERPVPKSDVPGEKTSPTQPFPTKPVPFDRQGVAIDDLIDFTPGLRAEAVELVKRYKIGPMFTPPALETPGGPLGTLMLPADAGGANWPGGSFDPETNRLYIHSHTIVFSLPNTPPDISTRGAANEAGLLPKNVAAPDAGRGGRGGRGAAPPAGPAQPAGAPGPGAAAGRGGTTVQGLPLIKPPYDRITAYDMNTGDLLWQKTHSSTPDNIKNHPALKGLNLPRLGQPGRTFLGTLVTKTLLIAGEGGMHTNAGGQSIALLRAYDKATGEDIPGEVNMPGRQTGSPMTYTFNGKQFIVLAVTTTGPDGGGELVAYALP